MMDSPPVFRRGRFGVAETGVVAASLAGKTYPELHIRNCISVTAYLANLAVTTPDFAFGSICPLLKTGGELPSWF